MVLDRWVDWNLVVEDELLWCFHFLDRCWVQFEFWRTPSRDIPVKRCARCPIMETLWSRLLKMAGCFLACSSIQESLTIEEPVGTDSWKAPALLHSLHDFLDEWCDTRRWPADGFRHLSAECNTMRYYTQQWSNLLVKLVLPNQINAQNQLKRTQRKRLSCVFIKQLLFYQVELEIYLR
jgi:hypothetical protein